MNGVKYLYSRFSQFFSYASTIDLERFKAIQRADRIAIEFSGIGDLSPEDVDVNNEPALHPSNQLPPPDMGENRYVYVFKCS